MKLAGKFAVVTGGSKGIGLAIAKRLVTEGASVLICSRHLKDLAKASTKIDPTGKKIFTIKADIAKLTDCKRLINQAKKLFGKVDILVNNGAIYGPIGPLEENLDSLWQKTIQTNFLGTVYCSKLVVPIMKKQKRGKIINLAGAGVGGKKAMPNFSAYYSSKMAVVGFSEVLAEELKNFNIQVNCISPGNVSTSLTDYLLFQGPQKVGQEIYNQTLKQKQSSVNSLDAALDLIVFLSGNTSNHISGKILSAKWDQIEALKKLKSNNHLFNLRRIDNQLFYEKD